MVYIPQYDDKEGAWASLDTCLLDAPRDLQHKYPIVALYEAAFPDKDLTLLTQFFRDTLGIPSCSWQDIVEELKDLNRRAISDFDRIRSHYEQLNKLRRRWITDDLNTDTIRSVFLHSSKARLLTDYRKTFESESLLFVQNERGQYKWVKPSECLWSSATEVREKVNLNNHYDDDLEDFFVTLLGVSRLTIDMVYDELHGVDRTTTVDQVKNLLRTMSALLETEMPKQKSKKLLKKRILPIRYPTGGVSLVSTEIEFAIADRRQLEQIFRDKIKMLDFTLSEVYQLKPLLDWMKLGDRFLFNLTKESSVVNPELSYPVSDPVRQIRKKAHALTRYGPAPSLISSAH